MSIVLEHLIKRYGPQLVVNDVSLEIADGELFVLLGGSGSGKSTILRMIAGLNPCDSGRILLHARDVTHLPPQERGTGFVFQNYSIFRHMTLAENIEFGLKIRKVSKADRARRCEELLDMVGLAGLGERYADQISGGQQQRVALARALAYEPTVLLLDEPLGALDVKIRVQLRRSLKEIQRRLHVTTILVTHDQEEAYELADRIGVLDRGRLLEIGQPEKLYFQPKKLFVASFLGGGTVLVGRISQGRARLGPVELTLPKDTVREEGASVEVLFRPEQVVLTEDEPKGERPVLGKGLVVEELFAGPLRRLRLRLPRLAGTRQVAPVVAFGEEGLLVDALAGAEFLRGDREWWVSLRGWTLLEQAPPQLLVIDTGASSTAALHLAAHLANQMRANVTVFSFGENPNLEAHRLSVKARIKQAGLSSADLRPGSGNLFQQVASVSAGALFDLIITPRQLEKADGELDAEVLALCQLPEVPVLITRNEDVSDIRRILICTRVGEPGKNDIRLGGRLARSLGARVTLLHVTPDATPAGALVARHLRQASGALQALEVPNEIVVQSSPHITETILRQAVNHDLVILGGHGALARTVFDRENVTLQVLRRALCPVLVVPPEGQ